MPSMRTTLVTSASSKVVLTRLGILRPCCQDTEWSMSLRSALAAARRGSTDMEQLGAFVDDRTGLMRSIGSDHVEQGVNRRAD